MSTTEQDFIDHARGKHLGQPKIDCVICIGIKDRDEARAQVLDLVRARHETQALHSEALTKARADAAQKGEALKVAQRKLAGTPILLIDEALTDTTSEAWLTERLAQARDEALEEVLKLPFLAPFPHSNDADAVRALKRGGR